MNYYYSIDGTNVAGPYPLEELAVHFAAGVLTASTQVCAEGQELWEPLSDVIDIPPSPPAQAPTRPQGRGPVARPTPVRPAMLPQEAQAAPKSSGSQIGGVIVGLVIFAAFIWNKFDTGNDSGAAKSPQTRPPSFAATPVPALKIETIEDAKRSVVGTWTYTGQNLKMLQSYFWVKWIINADGTIDMFRARPSDDNWGNAVTSNYEVLTGKYTDTGERYYALQIKDVYKPIAINPDGTLRNRTVDWDVDMKRGDKFPFSK